MAPERFWFSAWLVSQENTRGLPSTGLWCAKERCQSERLASNGWLSIFSPCLPHFSAFAPLSQTSVARSSFPQAAAPLSIPIASQCPPHSRAGAGRGPRGQHRELFVQPFNHPRRSQLALNVIY